MADLIKKTDTLNQGREKLNEAIKDAETAKNISAQADDKATQALSQSESTQTQLDTIVINGDSSVEAAQARVSTTGTAYGTLKERLDSEYQEVTTQLAQTTQQIVETEQKDFKRALSQSRQRKPQMVLTDDDGRNQVWDLLYPTIQQLQVPLTSCLITSKVGVSPETVTLEQVNEMKESGLFEFVSHTHTHPHLADLNTEEEIRQEMKLAKEWLIENRLTDDLIIYPYGSVDARVRKVAREFYRAGVDIDSGDHEINYPPLKTFQLERVYLENQVEIVKNKIDEAIANNGLLIVGMHCFYPTWSAEQLIEVVNYAKQQGIEIVKLSEAINNMGNIVDIGDTVNTERDNTAVIDCDGNIYGSMIGKYVSRLNGYGWTVTSDTLPSEFEKGKTTIVNISSSLASTSGFPESKAGTLYTHRLSSSSDAYTFQEFWLSESNIKYRRYFDRNTNEWSEWDRISNPINLLSGNSHPSTDTPNNHYDKEITIFNVTSGQSGFPSHSGSTNGGTLYTIALNTVEGYQFQIFKELRSPHIWTRYTTGGSWSSWETMNGAFTKNINTVTPTTPISEFRIGITLTHVNLAGATGFPDNDAGILTTYKQGSTGGWSYQEFKKYNSWDKYIRYLDSSGNWSAWKKYSLVEA